MENMEIFRYLAKRLFLTGGRKSLRPYSVSAILAGGSGRIK